MILSILMTSIRADSIVATYNLYGLSSLPASIASSDGIGGQPTLDSPGKIK
jgi:hypothetical protein